MGSKRTGKKITVLGVSWTFVVPPVVGRRLNNLCPQEMMHFGSKSAMLFRDAVDLHRLFADLARDIDDMLMMREIDRLSATADPLHDATS